MNIATPEFSLVVLVGPTSAGKTTLARAIFGQHEVISSDVCRAMVSDDPTSQRVTSDAFEVLHAIVNKRLKNRRLTVVDATSLQQNAREPLMQLARDHDCPITAIVFDLPQDVLYERNRARPDRNIPDHVVRNHIQALRQTKRQLRKEGFRRTPYIKSVEEAENAVLVRIPMRSNLTERTGPFDIIGDIHGCHLELQSLLQKMGYRESITDTGLNYAHPEGRTAVFVGDLVDRGPGSDVVLEIVMNMVETENALCVIGNHEDKLLRTMRGNPTNVSHGLQETLNQLEKRDEAFHNRVNAFLHGLPAHLMLDGEKLAVAHAGITENYQGRFSRRVSQFCMYGETNGETDEWGLPIRTNWARDYRGKATVVYGHTPVETAEFFNGTMNVDTGCVFGGQLSALRYPENEVVSMPALQIYYDAARPIRTGMQEKSHEHGHRSPDHHLLMIDDVLGRRPVATSLRGNISVRPEQAQAALEIVSRFAVDPRWMVYAPPTMAPCETSKLEEFLEYPTEAFEYFKEADVKTVMCQEKHMGSRAIVVAGKDAEAIERKFGIQDENAAMCYTRTGRPFFTDPDKTIETEFYQRVRAAIGKAGLWNELGTDWLIMDCELMPWSYKARELMWHQYAATGAAANNTMEHIMESLDQLSSRDIEQKPAVREMIEMRMQAAKLFRDAYRQYCWEVKNVEDIKLAPFHIMASQGRVHTDHEHNWHMNAAQRLQEADNRVFIGTDHLTVDVTDEAQVEAATQWWLSMTEAGGEGMVIKPMSFTAQSPRTMVQPAVKCRGPEYLRIIYGPEYNLPNNIDKVRRRSLRSKQNAAVREFALGVEGLERFVRDEPLHQVHECSFAVMALETQPMDPRL